MDVVFEWKKSGHDELGSGRESVSGFLEIWNGRGALALFLHKSACHNNHYPAIRNPFPVCAKASNGWKQ